jgi:hypothetical protein
MKREIKATPLTMDDSEVQLLIERWQSGLQSNREILSNLYPMDNNKQEFERVTERLAYSEFRLQYWLKIQEKRKGKEKGSIAKGLSGRQVVMERKVKTSNNMAQQN